LGLDLRGGGIILNHIRTLLANLDGPAPVLEAGEEYTPPAYRAVVLPYPLIKARIALFGETPDRRAVIYRVRQLLACIHASPLAEHALIDDPRITYLPLARGGFELPCGVSATSASGLALYFQGVPPTGSTGRTILDWLVAVADDGVTVTITGFGLPSFATRLIYNRGLADPIPLPGGGTLAIRIPPNAAGMSWRVTCLLPPPFDLPTAAARLAIAGEDTLLSLFGTSTVGVQGTWKNVWDAHRPLPDRLAAASLALAYRTGLALNRTG
jgi:hypothetical protein